MSDKIQDNVCPLGVAVSVFAGRWKPEILWYLQENNLRFTDFLHELEGVSRKVLTQQLRELERDGIVERVEGRYQITELGKSLSPLFQALIQWRDTHAEPIEEAREAFDRDPRNY